MKRLLSAVVLMGFLWCPTTTWAALSKQLVAPGTQVIFQDAGATPGGVLALNGMTAGTGKFSDRYDKGAGSIVAQWVWTCSFALTGTNVVGSFSEVYVSWSDGTNADGGLSTTNGALAADKRRNLKRVGTVVTDQTTSNTLMTGSGQAFIPTRYFSVGVFNATGLPMQGSNVGKCVFTPSPFEMQ